MKEKKSRLIFIDMARSFAILLMLEGHFIDLTLGAQYRSPDPHFVNPDFLVYDIWHLIRGYTSPMFLTMTGMVITYLFYSNNSKNYWGNSRIKKGYKRILELLFWGYLLNPSSFHILQCIGFGILGLLIIYGLYKLIKVIPLWIYYMAISFFIFSLFAPLQEQVKDGVRIPFPVGWPDFFQNMISAPLKRSMFPLAPGLGYTFFGAAIGVILHSKWIHVSNWRMSILLITLGTIIIIICENKLELVLGLILIKLAAFILIYAKKHETSKWNIPILLFSLGIVFIFFSTSIFNFAHHVIQETTGGSLIYLVKSNWLFDTLGWVLIILGILATFEKLVTIKENLFIRVGQNTLSIFILHMMLLYGAVIRIGVSTYYNFYNKSKNTLNPYEAGFGAALFITLFIVMIYYIDPLTIWFNKVLDIVIPIRKRINKKKSTKKIETTKVNEN